MPAPFFSNFPRISYDIEQNGNAIRCVDLTKRFIVEKIVRDRGTIYHSYRVLDGERPDTVAHRFYSNGKLDWLIMMTNLIFDPSFEWYMGYSDFKDFLKGKYGNIATAHQTVHSYEKIVQQQEIMDDGTLIPERVIIVDETTYHATVDTDRRIITMYEYEKRLNESRQKIRVITERFVPQVVAEAEKIYI